jgi:tRNA dimethylallyltransferase
MAFSEIRKPVIAIVGSTATGKTALGVALAQWLQTDVVSADSQVLYRQLDIGTAKPTEDEQAGIPHHMFDVADPDEIFSAATYQEQATAHLERLWAAGKVPIVVGGTGFYVRALLEADFIPDVPPNEVFRQELNVLAEREGSLFLHQRLQTLDPERAKDLHPNDRVRLIRALEIIEATGQPVPRQSQRKDRDVCWFGLTYDDRSLLDQRIDTRIDAMLAAGWLDEVESLVQRYGPTTHALGVAHGYPELVDVVQGKRSLANAVEQIQINIHQYARRQITWFKRNPDIHWFACDTITPPDLLAAAKGVITDWRKRDTI